MSNTDVPMLDVHATEEQRKAQNELGWDFTRSGFHDYVKRLLKEIEEHSKAQTAITSEQSRALHGLLPVREERAANQHVLDLIGQYKADQHLIDVAPLIASQVRKERILTTMGTPQTTLQNALIMAATSAAAGGKRSVGGSKQGKKRQSGKGERQSGKI
ncbi:hypothetical protein BGZ98_004655 [Dissophora globulifera]|nr:hypothetical protein BGZ98_004655 [Dissophora globulifera]